MERLIDDLTRLHEELNQGGDGGAFDIAGLAKEARDAIVRLNDFDNSQSIKLLEKVGRLEKEIAAYRQKEADGLLIELPEFPQDINNALEPLKVKSALDSELMKLNFRKKNKPKDISVLDYTIIAALTSVLTEAEKEL